MTTRYRCAACGNVTRFDVVSSRRTRAFHHYSIGGDLEIEEEEVLAADVESVTCRWCGASGDRVEHLTPEHLTPEHLTPEHLTPEHLTPEHLTPEQLHDQPS